MSNLRVSPEQLHALSGTITRVSADVRSQHHTLSQQLAPLFGADWAGAASTQFASLYTQFDQHSKGISDALDGIGLLLGRAGTAYAEIEQQIAASFR